jgi:hypothetical protein
MHDRPSDSRRTALGRRRRTGHGSAPEAENRFSGVVLIFERHREAVHGFQRENRCSKDERHDCETDRRPAGVQTTFCQSTAPPQRQTAWRSQYAERRGERNDLPPASAVPADCTGRESLSPGDDRRCRRLGVEPAQAVGGRLVGSGRPAQSVYRLATYSQQWPVRSSALSQPLGNCSRPERPIGSARGSAPPRETR